MEIGHNKPPSMAVTAGEVTQDLSRWMAEHPVVQTHEEAKEAKVLLDRSDLCVKDMEDERKAQTDPLNAKVKEINGSYAGPRELLEQVRDDLRCRIDRFLVELEGRRGEEATAAILESERLEGLARQAEQRELDAKRDAACGELGIDVAGVTSAADWAYAEYLTAKRAAELLQRATKVKITGGFKRALSLRDVEIVEITDPLVAVTEILQHKMGFFIMQDAILKAARKYKKLTGTYPVGVNIITERRS